MNKALRTKLGLLRSKIMYYWKPFNRRRLRKWYAPFLQKGDLCFDIGAHLGNRSDAWLGLGAKVVAVEPQPSCVQFLNNKFSAQVKTQQFTLLPCAIGAAPATATLHISTLTPTVSTLANTDWRRMVNDTSGFEVKWDDTITVEVQTLDDLIRQYGLPTFCKIDVEDYEVEVLKGLSQPIPKLSFEYFSTTPSQTLACLELIHQLGNYKFNWSVGESQEWSSPHYLTYPEIKAIFEKGFPELGIHSGDIYAINQ